ncbi:MAG TPA: nucleotide exchange factor GrpE [Patescibacteria group bacterium]
MKNKKVQEKKVEKEGKEVGELKNQLARALADYDNLRRRTEEEKSIWIKFATGKFIQSLLPILDAIEASLTHTKDQGLAIAVGQLKDLLASEGLEEIKPKKSEEFDENLEEAIEVVGGKKEDFGKIAEVVMSGWKFKDGPVIRHAKVKVYQKGLDN